MMVHYNDKHYLQWGVDFLVFFGLVLFILNWLLVQGFTKYMDSALGAWVSTRVLSLHRYHPQNVQSYQKNILQSTLLFL